MIHEEIGMNRQLEKGSDTNQRKQYFIRDLAMSEETSPNYTNKQGKTLHYNSNEDGLHLFASALATVDNVGLGVGLDQMFDLINASNIEEAYLVDFLPEVSLTSRAICEAGADFFDKHGRYPTADELIGYFSKGKESDLKNMLSGLGYSEQQITQVEHIRDNISLRGDSSPISLEEYLKARMESSQLDQNSFNWLATSKGIEKIITRYMQGKIHFITADLTGDKSMKLIAKALTNNQQRLGFVYLSNAEGYVAKSEQSEKFSENMGTIPTDDHSIILRTLGSVPGEMYEREKPLSNPSLKTLFTPWHYNTETFSHWRQNSFRVPNDPFFFVNNSKPITHIT